MIYRLNDNEYKLNSTLENTTLLRDNFFVVPTR